MNFLAKAVLGAATAWHSLPSQQIARRRNPGAYCGNDAGTEVTGSVHALHVKMIINASTSG